MAQRTVLVTGGAAGIGAGIVRRFADGQHALGIIDINGAAAATLAESLSDVCPAVGIQADISDEDQVKAAIEEACGKLGRIQVLVNNAGIEVNGSVSELTAAEWDRQIDVNLRGTFLVSKYVVEQMGGAGGCIINISSVHGFVSYPGCAAYDATKTGLLGLTRAMALDHGPAGIRVNAVCPGYIDTPLMERWLASVPDREATLRKVMEVHPLGRVGTAQDVADAVYFLCSDRASFISGASLVVDGGMSIAGH